MPRAESGKLEITAGQSADVLRSTTIASLDGTNTGQLQKLFDGQTGRARFLGSFDRGKNRNPDPQGKTATGWQRQPLDSIPDCLRDTWGIVAVFDPGHSIPDFVGQQSGLAQLLEPNGQRISLGPTLKTGIPATGFCTLPGFLS